MTERKDNIVDINDFHWRMKRAIGQGEETEIILDTSPPLRVQFESEEKNPEPQPSTIQRSGLYFDDAPFIYTLAMEQASQENGFVGFNFPSFAANIVHEKMVMDFPEEGKYRMTSLFRLPRSLSKLDIVDLFQRLKQDDPPISLRQNHGRYFFDIPSTKMGLDIRTEIDIELDEESRKTAIVFSLLGGKEVKEGEGRDVFALLSGAEDLDSSLEQYAKVLQKTIFHIGSPQLKRGQSLVITHEESNQPLHDELPLNPL